MRLNFRRLEKSLLLRVEDRLRDLLPDAQVKSTKNTIVITWDTFQGEVTVTALTTACLAEERSNWGAIAGEFCNLVAARVQSWFGGALSDTSELQSVFPAVEAADPIEDALLREAAPTDELRIASQDWLDGLRIEFDYRGASGQRRLLLRDVTGLQVDIAHLAAAANKNLAEAADTVEIVAVSTTGAGANIYCAEVDGIAPGLLTGVQGHTRLFATYEASGTAPRRILACAPRSNLLYFCDIANKSAASEMVSLSWRAFEADSTESVPLSPRLFTLSAPGEIGYLDVGLTKDRVPDWDVQTIGSVNLAIPPGWRVDEQDGQHVLWTSGDGPRVRVRLVPSGGGSPKKAHELAERVRSRHGVSAPIGHGFFNGLPWAWVDTGVHSECATASMFVVLSSGLAVLQTEVPTTSEQGDQSSLQRAIATIHQAPQPGS